MDRSATKLGCAMVRLDLIPKLTPKTSGTHHVLAVAASCFFHAAVIGLLLGVTLFYRVKPLPQPTGSQEHAPSLTLSTLIITAALPPKTEPTAPQPENPAAITPPTPKPLASPLPAPDAQAVPVLAAEPPKSTPAQALKPPSEHPAKATSSIAKTSPVKPKSAMAAVFASSYAPGENVLPHPPYPAEAQNLGESGTVIMSVTFNASGKVTEAEVAQSSGVRLLDATTRSFILTHWHSTAYAGQTVTQPVCYAAQ